MDENLNLDLDNIEANTEEKLKVKNRFEKLSEKVIIASQEKDAALAKSTADSQARATAEKERDFFKNFSQISSKHPQAINFQDQILERVNRGYDAEEAALAVLAKEGKLSPEPVQRTAPQVEGGSAPTAFEGNKSIENMTPDEKLDALREAEKTGDLARALRPR